MKRQLEKIASPKLGGIGSGTHQWAPDFPMSGVERNHNKFVPMQFRTQPAHIPGGFQRQATNLALFEGGEYERCNVIIAAVDVVKYEMNMYMCSR